MLINTKNIRASVLDSVGSSVAASVRASVGDSVWVRVDAKVLTSVEDGVWASVWATRDKGDLC